MSDSIDGKRLAAIVAGLAEKFRNPEFMVLRAYEDFKVLQHNLEVQRLEKEAQYQNEHKRYIG